MGFHASPGFSVGRERGFCDSVRLDVKDSRVAVMLSLDRRELNFCQVSLVNKTSVQGAACGCLNCLRIRVEVQANTTERTVTSQQAIFM